MNKEQPEALRLAQLIDYHTPIDFDGHLAQAATELRRLHAENEALRAQIGRGVPDVATPGPWFVRRLERDEKLRDCFVSAPDCQGFAYDAEILGDDEYRDDLSRKLADCELIVAAVNAYRAGALASAPPAPQANKTHVLVPLRMTRAMQDVVSEEDWSWADLLAAAEAVTEDEFAVAEQTEPIMPQAAVMQQKPLLFSEIWDNDAIMEVNADARLPFEMIERFVRAIEAAHNIGEKK